MLTKRLAAGGIATLGRTAWGLQLYLTVDDALLLGEPIASAIISYLSFFTITTNLAITMCLTLIALEPDEDSFWNWPGVESALALYILVVAIVYAAVLQGLWIPQGLQFVTERYFHLVLPIIYVSYWRVFSTRFIGRSILFYTCAIR